MHAGAPQDAQPASPSNAADRAPWFDLGTDDDPASWLGLEAAMPPAWDGTCSSADAHAARSGT